MFKIKKYIPDIVVAIILIAGIGLLAYPTIGDYINALHSSKAIGSYVEKTKDLSKEEKENLLREAREYNESLVGKVNRYYLNEEEKRVAIAEMMRVLKKDGRIILGDLMFQNKAEEQKIRSTLSPEQIKELNGEYYSYLHLLIKEVEQYEKRVVYKRIDRFNYVVAIQ